MSQMKLVNCLVPFVRTIWRNLKLKTLLGICMKSCHLYMHWLDKRKKEVGVSNGIEVNGADSVKLVQEYVNEDYKRIKV